RAAKPAHRDLRLLRVGLHDHLRCDRAGPRARRRHDRAPNDRAGRARSLRRREGVPFLRGCSSGRDRSGQGAHAGARPRHRLDQGRVPRAHVRAGGAPRSLHRAGLRADDGPGAPAVDRAPRRAGLSGRGRHDGALRVGRARLRVPARSRYGPLRAERVPLAHLAVWIDDPQRARRRRVDGRAAERPPALQPDERDGPLPSAVRLGAADAEGLQDGRLTMPPSKEMIGRVLSTGSATVTAEHVAGFARALGDANPEYAKLAPPTYPIAFMTQAMSGGMETFLELGLNFMTLVHGEQEFEYVRPVKIGETLELTGRIADIYDKTSSSGGVL